jgi:aarF domain-containing kinase
MEFLDGVKLVDGIKEKLGKVAALQGKSVDDLMAENVAAMKEGTFRYKSIAEARQEQQRIRYYLAARDWLLTLNVPRLVYNWSPARLVTGPMEYVLTDAPVDLGRTLELLCLVEGDQIFQDGLFNGDCHPGNVMLLKDGRLGLIDYGQVKRMTVKERIIFAKLVLAHSRMDKKEVTRLCFSEMGTVTKRMDPEIAYLTSAFWVDRMTPDIMQDRNIHHFMEWVEACDPMVHLPEEYIFACRVSVLLRGMGKAFGLDVSLPYPYSSISSFTVLCF